MEMDIIIETLRAIVVGGILFCFLWVRHNKEFSHVPGWKTMFYGFVLIFFGTVIDITDNFPSLERFVVIGDTEVQAILEKIGGYLVGYLLVAVGIWQWLPKLAEHSRSAQQKHELEIQEQRLRVLKATMISVKDIMHNLTSNIEEYKNQAQKKNSLNDDACAFMNYIVQDTAERLEKLSHLDSTPEKPMACGIGIDYEGAFSNKIPHPPTRDET